MWHRVARRCDRGGDGARVPSQNNGPMAGGRGNWISVTWVVSAAGNGLWPYPD